MRMTQQLTVLLASFLGLSLNTPASNAEISTFAEAAIGLGVQSLHDEEDRAAASKVVKLAGGVQLLPILSTSVVAYSWGVVQDDQREDAVQFDGISIGWEVVAHVPLSSANIPLGPYVRLGGHCWAATVSGLAQPWAKNGCSDLTAAGISFSTNRKRRGEGALYFEFSKTRFDEVTSGSIIAGVKTSF